MTEVAETKVKSGQVLVPQPAAEVFRDYGVEELIDFISRLEQVKKEDPTALIEALHKDNFTDPQYARINEARWGLPEIEYCFLLNVYTTSPWPVYRINNGAVRWFRNWLPKERYRVEVDDKTEINEEADLREASLKMQEYRIKICYLAKDGKDLERIRNFLEKIPVDGGDLPKKGETFFCYD